MDIKEVKSCLSGISLADHKGDVNNELDVLCKYLDLPAPIWCDEYDHYVMAWDVEDHLSDLDEETDHYCQLTHPEDY